MAFLQSQRLKTRHCPFEDEESNKCTGRILFGFKSCAVPLSGVKIALNLKLCRTLLLHRNNRARLALSDSLKIIFSL